MFLYSQLRCPVCNQEPATRVWQGRKVGPMCYTILRAAPTPTYVQIPESYSKADPNY